MIVTRGLSLYARLEDIKFHRKIFGIINILIVTNSMPPGDPSQLFQVGTEWSLGGYNIMTYFVRNNYLQATPFEAVCPVPKSLR